MLANLNSSPIEFSDGHLLPEKLCLLLLWNHLERKQKLVVVVYYNKRLKWKQKNMFLRVQTPIFCNQQI